MAGRTTSNLRYGRATAYAPSFDSQFDPIELLGTQIPFVDPFENEFQASSSTSMSIMDILIVIPELQGDARDIPMDECEPLQRTPSIPPAGPAMIVLEPPQAVSERARLTPDQAIRIFKLRKTKTARTAGLLAAEYGISPKAIRDIWTKKSWVQDTRPFWSK